MTKIKEPNQKFLYISPLKDCENEVALQMARLIEAFMLANIGVQLDFIECRVNQIYQYADKIMKEKNV